MTCPVCGAWAPDADEGYGADTICPNCASVGWVETATGEIVNEQDDVFEAAMTDPRRA